MYYYNFCTELYEVMIWIDAFCIGKPPKFRLLHKNQTFTQKSDFYTKIRLFQNSFVPKV